MQGHERRKFFRVHDDLSFEFRQIDGEEFRRLKDIIQRGTGQIIEGVNEIYSLTEKKSRGGNDEVVACLQAINRKLDIIVDYLLKKPGIETYRSLRTDVSISGSGVQFEYHKPFREGEYIELRFVIPVVPYPRITVLCEAVGKLDADIPAGDKFVVVLKFLVINERDRDALINYIFEKEREQLRQQKETES